MKKTVILIVVLLIASISGKSTAQEKSGGMSFVSMHTGAFFPSISGFKDVYHSPCAFINGISLGTNFINQNTFFYLKAMYFQKSGTPITYHINYNNETGEVTKWTTQEGTCTYKQLICNAGVQYNIKFRLSNILFLNGGIALVKQSEKIKNSASANNGKGMPCYFFGIGYEKCVLEKISLFSEFQYNFDWKILNILGLKYGGANINIGFRYYF